MPIGSCDVSAAIVGIRRVHAGLVSGLVSIPLKYAVVERERRYLVAGVPDGVVVTRDIVDRYVTGTRLRLREVREPDGIVTRKLGQKVRLDEGPAEVACTNFYLDDAEWEVLAALPGRHLRKRRHIVERDGLRVAIDEHEDGTLVAEIDDGDQPSTLVPDWLDIVQDVTDDESWTGGSLAS
ncbi:MAG: hypothetical protein CMJ44_09100 [Pimelobacter sp.]|nr:hypothetical protein [Pimelobacter sp.]